MSSVEIKVGDRICIVDPKDTYGEYEKGDCGVVAALDMDVEGLIGVDVKFDKYEDGYTMYVYPEEFVVIEKDVSTSFPDHKEEHFANKEAVTSSLSRKEERIPSKDVTVSSAESIRSNILRIREKRNDLLMEITALDKEEADCVEKLKNLGFVLHESALQAPTEKKTVLYADDIEEDMNDPRNWKVGDIIECIDSDIAPVGSLATITEIDGDTLYRSGGEGFISGCFNVETKNIWKFRSRPL